MEPFFFAIFLPTLVQAGESKPNRHSKKRKSKRSVKIPCSLLQVRNGWRRYGNGFQTTGEEKRFN